MRLSLFGLVFSAGPILGGCASDAKPSEPSPRPAIVAAAVQTSAEEVRRLAGVVQAADRVPLSFEVRGEVASVQVDIGDAFERGDVLAQIEPRTHRLRLEQQRADLVRAEAAAREARTNLRRMTALLRRDVIAESEYDSAKARADTTRGQVELVQASVGLAEEDLQDTSLRAPFDGEVAVRSVEPSQFVEPGRVVFEVVSAEAGLEVKVSVPETLVDRLEIGTLHDVHFPTQRGLDTEAILTNIAADASTTNAFPATLLIENAPTGLRPGLTAEVDLRIRASSHGTTSTPLTAVQIPVSALRASSNRDTTVFVVDEDNRVHARTVSVDNLSGAFATISSGLDPGEHVVTKGVTFLKDGQTISRLDSGVARYLK
ncbi:MAG: efflux RND transporter periplasmic adaptor subunit [Myxococcota bacterium]